MATSEDREKEMIMTHRITGKKVKCTVGDFCDLIETLWPDKEEQKKVLQEIFRD